MRGSGTQGRRGRRGRGGYKLGRCQRKWLGAQEGGAGAARSQTRALFPVRRREGARILRANKDLCGRSPRQMWSRCGRRVAGGGSRMGPLGPRKELEFHSPLSASPWRILSGKEQRGVPTPFLWGMLKIRGGMLPALRVSCTLHKFDPFPTLERFLGTLCSNLAPAPPNPCTPNFLGVLSRLHYLLGITVPEPPSHHPGTGSQGSNLHLNDAFYLQAPSCFAYSWVTEPEFVAGLFTNL